MSNGSHRTWRKKETNCQQRQIFQATAHYNCRQAELHWTPTVPPFLPVWFEWIFGNTRPVDPVLGRPEGRTLGCSCAPSRACGDQWWRYQWWLGDARLVKLELDSSADFTSIRGRCSGNQVIHSIRCRLGSWDSVMMIFLVNFLCVIDSDSYWAVGSFYFQPENNQETRREKPW